MPTVLRIAGYRFFFFSNEGNEPPHIHVQKAEQYAKFWLEPRRLAVNSGYNSRELTQIGELIEQHRDLLLEAWHGYFSR
ncbi:MAG: DUF4160 domain-containing protein [Chloroflexota bacterium]|nr:DUF4160 domain-containing protein [Chloroflexota bacterium]